MNIFLTGQVQVGKSTIINKFIESHSNLNIGGFKTVSNFNEDIGVYGGVYIIPASSKTYEFNSQCHVGNRVSGKKAFPKVFDIKGSEFLDSCNYCDLIIMDEIGFMESKAKKFSKVVLETLGGDVPVIGVVKPMMQGLPLAIKQHEKTKVLEVTVENRDDQYLNFEKLLEKELGF